MQPNSGLRRQVQQLNKESMIYRWNKGEYMAVFERRERKSKIV